MTHLRVQYAYNVPVLEIGLRISQPSYKESCYLENILSSLNILEKCGVEKWGAFFFPSLACMEKHGVEDKKVPSMCTLLMIEECIRHWFHNSWYRERMREREKEVILSLEWNFFFFPPLFKLGYTHATHVPLSLPYIETLWWVPHTYY